MSGPQSKAVFGTANLTNPAGSGGGVTYFAHVGGFAFGALTIRLLVPQAQADSAGVHGVVTVGPCRSRVRRADRHRLSEPMPPTRSPCMRPVLSRPPGTAARIRFAIFPDGRNRRAGVVGAEW